MTGGAFEGDTSAATRQHLTKVARGGALGLVGAVVSAGAGFLLVLAVANLFSPDTAGRFFTTTSVFLVAAAFATLGTETGLDRFMLRYEIQGRTADIPAVLRTAFVPTLTFAVVLGLALIVLAEPLAGWIGLDGGQSVTTLRILGSFLPLTALNSLSLAGTRAFGYIRPTALLDNVVRAAAQPLLVVAAAYAGAGLVGMTTAWVLPYGVTAGVSLVVLRRFLRRRRRGWTSAGPAGADRSAIRGEFWRFTWPRAVTRVSQMAIQRLDLILVAALRSPTEAAVYAAATRFVALGQFGNQAILQVLQPRFTALLAAGDAEALRGVYRVATAWSMAVSWPIYLAVGCAPLAYLGMFGAEYQQSGVPVVLLMVLAMLFGVASGPADTLLLMSGRSGLSLMNSLVALTLDVTLCLLLIPSLGITGAAVAWAVAVVTRCLLAFVQIRSSLRVVSVGRPALVVAGAAVLGLVLPLLAVGALVQLDIRGLAVAVVACLPLYAGLLWLGRRTLMLDVLRALFTRRSA